MNTLINYVIEINLSLVFFYLVYVVVLRNENQFRAKRLFLLGAMIFSWVFPLFTFTTVNSTYIPSLSQSMPAHWLPELVITAEGQAQATSQSMLPAILLTYKIVAVIVLMLLLLRVGKIIWLLQSANQYRWKNFTVAESTRIAGTFSFFHLIFMSQDQSLTPEEKEAVLHHEEVHIRQFHSVDILLINLMQVICWFNPVILLYKKSLVQLHEFEADAHAVQTQDVNRYCGLLAKVALQQNGFVLANHFTNSFTLKRIMMMKTISKKISQWKIAITFLSAILVFAVVACQDQIVNEISQSTVTQADFPAVVKHDIDTKYAAQYPGAKFNYLEGDADEIRNKFRNSPQPLQILLNTYHFSERQTTGILLVDVSSQELKNKDDVYVIVEESAEPEGGMENYWKILGSKIQYPLEARQRGVEGRVFVEFVVDEVGQLSDFKLLKGIGAGCDEEALRVMTQSPPWKPGKQRGVAVKQRMVIPIIFKLESDGNTNIKLGGVTKSNQTMVVDGSLVKEGDKSFMIGHVTNSEGKPLPGMNIVLEGTTVGTVSDLNGAYKLLVPDNSGTLVFSFVGFETKRIPF